MVLKLEKLHSLDTLVSDIFEDDESSEELNMEGLKKYFELLTKASPQIDFSIETEEGRKLYSNHLPVEMK
jgi:hypothetical protein